MPTVTLLEKLYGDASAKAVESKLQTLCRDLKTTLQVVEVTDRGWIRVQIEGEDEVVALSLVEKQFGLAPTDVTHIKKDAVYRGKIISSGKNIMEMHVDLGVFSPSPMDAVVSLQRLQAQLVDGRKIPLQQIIKLFSLLGNFPLEVFIRHIEQARNCFLAELSEKQLSLFYDWIGSNLERVIVLGAFLDDVENTVKTSGHFRDIIGVESLGLLEQVIVCKLGTYGVGLIPKIGRWLSNTVLGVFSPKEIRRYAVV